MIAIHERLAAQGKLAPEEASCLAEEKVRRDRMQRTLRTRLMERVATGSGFFQGVRKDASALGQTLAEIFAKLRDEAIPTLYPKFEMGNRPVRPDDAEKLLTATNLHGLPPIFYEAPEGLNLVIRQSGKAVPNLNAEICRELSWRCCSVAGPSKSRIRAASTATTTILLAGRRLLTTMRSAPPRLHRAKRST
jgi:hypothetical protein